jgi:hypothetical protein
MEALEAHFGLDQYAPEAADASAEGEAASAEA